MKSIIHSPRFHRFGEMLVPFLTWVLITFPLWVSPFHPAIVAYFIIAFDLYFLYKSFTTAYFATVSFKEILTHIPIPFHKQLLTEPKAKEIKHVIIIPNYKEPIYKLEETIESITKGNYPFKNMVLMLAFESREEEAQEKEKQLKEKYGSFFTEIMASYHILTDNEVPGKASNQTFAARIIDTYVQEKKWNREDVIITISDADSHFAENYFSYLTLEYLKDPLRQYHFYWAPVLFYNNFWQLPFFVRMQATISSLMNLSILSQKDKLIQISTYSSSLWLLHEVDFWDVDIIPEDWHIYFQAFFKFGEKVRTVPIYSLINGDAVYSGGMIKTLKNRYEQEKRWAWGVSDVGYAWKRFFTTPDIKPWIKIKKMYYLAERHLLWPTSFFILTLSASVPPLVNPVFKRTVLGFLLPQLSGLILTLASLMLVLYIYLDIKLRQQVKIHTKPINVPFLIVQWYLLPIVSFVLSSLPALDAHTRLLFGKKIVYKVTEKV